MQVNIFTEMRINFQVVQKLEIIYLENKIRYVEVGIPTSSGKAIFYLSLAFR